MDIPVCGLGLPLIPPLAPLMAGLVPLRGRLVPGTSNLVALTAGLVVVALVSTSDLSEIRHNINSVIFFMPEVGFGDVT